MKPRTAARLAWGILAFIVVSAVVSITLALESQRYDIFFVAVLAIFPVVGVVLASRRPSNPLGWIMLGIGVVWALPSGTYGVYGLIEGRHLPGAAYLVRRRQRAVQRNELFPQHQRDVERCLEQHVVEPQLVGLWWRRIEWWWWRWRRRRRVLRAAAEPV